ncbi:unnamed protein product, partial [Ectocarpus sp. 4 AP-2014]
GLGCARFKGEKRCWNRAHHDGAADRSDLDTRTQACRTAAVTAVL